MIKKDDILVPVIMSRAFYKSVKAHAKKKDMRVGPLVRHLLKVALGIVEE